jgi:hypothetical protein
MRQEGAAKQKAIHSKIYSKKIVTHRVLYKI